VRLFEPDLVASETDHLIALWERAECYRYCIGVRREHCDSPNRA